MRKYKKVLQKYEKREKNLCDKCKKEIEHPSYLLIGCSFLFTIFLLTLISIGVIFGIRATELFSIGERVIIIFLTFLLTFGFLLYPLKIEDIKKLYNQPIMKKYKRIGNLYFCPYLFIIIYYGFIILSKGETNLSFLFTLGLWTFILLLGFPILMNLLKNIEKKRGKKIFFKK